MKLFGTILMLVATSFAANTYTGWVSDAQCAGSRARSGTFTATNPACARKCVKEGKSVVLVSEELRKVFTIENPDTLKSQVGNKVRVSATAPKDGSLYIQTVEFVEEGHPECGRKPLKK